MITMKVLPAVVTEGEANVCELPAAVVVIIVPEYAATIAAVVAALAAGLVAVVILETLV
ncbi:MAG: hypothetical protein ILNGONEN_01662 [Syntrophorhabdaceae bacterium]|nr:hypothetical protein [Syntrophorhabdaceae bacterium]